MNPTWSTRLASADPSPTSNRPSGVETVDFVDQGREVVQRERAFDDEVAIRLELQPFINRQDVLQTA